MGLLKYLAWYTAKRLKFGAMSAEIIERLLSEPVKQARDGPLSMSVVSPAASELQTLYDLVATYQPERTLEIGLALGASSVVIASAKAGLAPHVAVDPFQYVYNDAGLIEIAKAGLRVDHIPELSERYLPAAHDRGDRFNFIFIDGAHDIGHVVSDTFWSDRLLNPEGVIVLHDGLLISSMAAVTYLMKEQGYRVIPLKSDSKRWLRPIRYLLRLPASSCLKVIPKMHRSLIALQKPKH